MASSINAPKGYAYVLAREGHGPAPVPFSFLLVEPAHLPINAWVPAWMRNLPPQATRTKTIGIVRLYQIGKP